MNMFDAAVYLVAFVAVVAGFNSGLLRSVATILCYVAAAPSFISPMLAGQSDAAAAPWARNSLLFFGLFLATGVALGALSRTALAEVVGARISIPDRLAGAVLGAVRIGLVAVMMVLIFDRLIPADREPAFLRGSQLRPILSMAGQKGLKSLPPETTAFIDQLKKDRGL
jgi:membrane protein required for colicin V production